MPERQTNWPDFAHWMLAVGNKEVCGKLEDCKLPYNHVGKHDWEAQAGATQEEHADDT